MTGRSKETRQLIQRGEHLLEVKRPGEALHEFERAMALAPEDDEILCHMARACSMLDDHKRAMDYVTRAIAANPNEEWAFRIKANIHLQRGERTSAYKAATRALQLQPEYVECLWMLANCALGLERREEAKMLAEILVKQAPESTYGHSLMGEVALVRQELPDAARHYEKVLELDPNNEHALEALASIRNAHNKYGESVSLLRGAMSVDPNPEVRQNSFKDSMQRFALFGQANERRKSVAGLLVMAFVAYILLGLAAFSVFEPRESYRVVFMFGPVAIVLLGIPFLRGRFFAAQSAQLHSIYRSFSSRQRKRTLLASVVVVATAYAIAGLIYFDVGDRQIFLMPIWLFVAAIWIYLLAITFRLATLCLSDMWTKLFRSDKPADDRGIPLVMIALPIITIATLAFGLWRGNGTALILFMVGAVVSAVIFLQRFQLATGVALFLSGVLLLIASVWGQQDMEYSALDDFGLVIGVVGLVAMGLDGMARLQRYWERRRISRILDAGNGDAIAGD